MGDAPSRRRVELLGEIADGGMAVVRRGVLVDGGARRTVIVKQLRPELEGRPSMVQMFKDEGELGLLLDHPNIVRTLDQFVHNNRRCIALEYMDGGTLAEAMLNGRALGPFPVSWVLHVGEQIARGLHHAHEARTPTGKKLNVVHRDVTPHNVLLSLAGDIKLSDFGVARMEERRTDETRTGVIKGKLGYVSPEILLAQPFDRRADVWSLGVVLHEMFTQRRLFDDQSDHLLMKKIVEERPPTVQSTRSDIPNAVQDILDKALAHDPKDRYATAAALADDLRHELEQLEGPTVDYRDSFVRFMLDAARAKRLEGTEAIGKSDRSRTIPLLRRRPAEGWHYLQDYIDGLPDGLHSYPDHTIKAAFFRGTINSMPGELDLDRLPPYMRRFVEDPPPSSTWIPETVVLGLLLATIDQFFDSEPDFLTHNMNVNRAILTGPLYRALFLFISPTRLLRGHTARWKKIHRGIGLNIELTGERSFYAKFTYPKGLVHRLHALNFRDIFPVALGFAGARSTECELVAYDTTHCVMEGSWTE